MSFCLALWKVDAKIEGTVLRVNLGFSELIEIPEEFENVSAAAAREAKRRPVVAEVLAEGVPVTAFLVFVSG